MNFKCFVSLLILFPIFSMATLARSTNSELGVPYIQNYGEKDYNANPQNWAIVQDIRGVMFFGNTAGVLEFDGVHWRLRNPAIALSLAVDSSGVVYVGSLGDLGYLQPDSSGQLVFTSLKDSIPKENRNFHDVWTTLNVDGAIYYQTRNYLFRWAERKMKIFSSHSGFQSVFSIGKNLYTNQSGIGLTQMRGDSLILIPGGAKFAYLGVTTMLPFGKGTILIGTANQGLFLYNGTVVRPFPTELDAFFKENILYSGNRLPDGTFALGTRRGGLAIMNRKGKLIRILDKNNGLRDATVSNSYPDRQGGLWLALNNGIARVELNTPFTSFGQENGLKGHVLAVTRHRGVLYVGTSVGVFYFPRRKKITKTGSNSSFVSGRFLPVKNIQAQCWSFLSWGGILLVATTEGVYGIRKDQAGLLKTGWAYSTFLYRDPLKKDRIFVGLADGLAILKLKNGKIMDGGRVKGITERVRTISRDGANRLWLGTIFSGVLRVLSLQTQNGTLQAKVKKYGSKEGITGAQINVYAVNGHLEAGTEKGLRRYDPRSDFFRSDATFAAVLADSTRDVAYTVPDAYGNVWIYSGFGEAVGQWDLALAVRDNAGKYQWKDRPFKRIKASGSVYTIYPEKSGVTWFGTSQGIIRYDSRKSINDEAPFPMLIRKVTVNSDSTIFRGNLPPLARAQLPTLDYHHNALRFEFALPFYDDLPANRYSFKLKGFDKKWSAWTSEVRKDYTNLHEGDYAFEVRGKNVYGRVSQPAMFRFSILPPWYRTIWAYALYLGLGVLALAGAVRWRSRKLEQENRRLEGIVAERTRELREKSEAIQKKNQELEKTHRMVRAINSEINFLDVMRAILHQLEAIPGIERAGALIFDEKVKGYRFLIATGKNIESLRDIRWTVHEAEQTLLAGAEEVDTDIFLNSGAPSTGLPAFSGVKSRLTLRVRIRNRVGGYLVLENMSKQQAFGLQDAKLLFLLKEHIISAFIKAKILELVKQERDRSDELLTNILPAEIIQEWKNNGIIKPRRFEETSILFTDFKGFTNTVATMPAWKLVAELNEIFNFFDDLIEQKGLEKLKTIGDSYMIAGGLPRETTDHTIRCIEAAQKMLAYIRERNLTSSIKWEMRVGIHTGPVVAGVVGKKKFTYDVWGDTVNIASRMESSGIPGKINISAYTRDLVKDVYECEYRGKIEVKGKGKVDMYLVKNPIVSA